MNSLPRGTRHARRIASPFFASKLGSNRRPSLPLERGLPANQTPRFISRSESSFIAGKHRSHRVRGAPGASRHRSSRASSAPTGYAARQADRVIVHRGQAPLPQGTRHARRIASSSVAGKHRSHWVRGTPGASRHRSSRASSAPTGYAARQAHRVIVLGEQTRLQQATESSVGARLARESQRLGVADCVRFTVGAVLARDER